MNPIFTKHIGEFKYEVFFDSDSIIDQDFESDQQEREYRSKFESGELSMYGVCKYDVCSCCCMYREIDSLWAISAEDAEQALSHYLDC